jgi:uncharacterized membrane protein YedE/YeeE
MRQNAIFLILGTSFGFALSRGGATDYDVIQRMFLLESFQLYGILGTAVLITGLGLRWMEARGRRMGGAPLAIRPKPFNRGTIAGSLLFGVGWSMTGMCPGPVLVNIGEGKLYALPTFAGVLAGTWWVGRFYDRLRVPMGLPPAAEREG